MAIIDGHYFLYLIFLFPSGNNLKVRIALVRYPSPTLKLQTLSYNHYTTVAFADAFSFFILPDLFLPLWKQLNSVHVICRKRSLPLKNLQHSALTTTLPWLQTPKSFLLTNSFWPLWKEAKIAYQVVQERSPSLTLATLCTDQYTTVNLAEGSYFFHLSNPFLPL